MVNLNYHNIQESFYLVIAFGFILILSTPNPNHSSVTYVQILQIFML